MAIPLRAALVAAFACAALPRGAFAADGPAHAIARIDVTRFDAGEVVRGTPVIHAFEIRNDGDALLSVDAKPGCGCTVADYDKIVPPHAAAAIRATVSTIGFKGPISKSITVSTSDPDHPTFTLHVDANVLVPLDVQPGETVSFVGPLDTLKPQSVTITSASGKAFDVLSVETGSVPVKVTAAATPGLPQAPPARGALASGAPSYVLSIAPGAGMIAGRVDGTILVHTTLPQATVLTLHVIGNVTGDVAYAPLRLTIRTGPGAPASERKASAKLTSRSGKPFTITGATCDSPSFRARVTKGADASWEVEVEYVGAPQPEAIAGRVFVQTTDPRQPRLEIPIWGRPEADLASSRPATADTPLRQP